MTLQKFLEKIEKTQFPICIKNVCAPPDDDKIKVNEVVYDCFYLSR